MNLSARNGWLDEEGRVYIIFTIEEIKGALGCAEKKAVKLLDELEKKCGLIERKRQGLGKPNLIYVKNFISGSVERQFLNCQKDNSGVVKNTIQELSKAQGNNTDTNYIDFSDTDPFFPSGFCGKEVDETDEFTRYYQYFYEQLSMDYLKQDYPYDHETLDLILHLIVEVMCSNRQQIRIASDDKPVEIVRSSFMKLDSEHIRFVMSSFKENTTDTTLNHTVWKDAKNRIVDLHCFEYTGEGEILYEGDNFPVETFSGKGKIEEIEVSCIEPYSQVMFHLGYEFDENDVHDVKLLCETFHIEIPNEYR